MYVEAPPSEKKILDELEPGQALKVLEAPADPRARETYLHWDKVRRLSPPVGLSAEEWWLRIKMGRLTTWRGIPLTDPDGRPFGYSLTDSVLRSLHYIDQHCAGEVAMGEVVTSDRQARQRYLVNSLEEEAIRSSQLEGATTSRERAKELLRSGREPKDRSERMIVNNYRALQFMHGEMGEELSPELVLELHRIVTDGTLEDPSAAGRLQTPSDERVAVFDRDDGSPIHRPPPAEQLPERLQLLCEFANEGDDGEHFVHPVVRAVLLHFWLAYDHPFEDGNGRTARILFFWLMRTKGYWLVEYLPISRILRVAPAKYARAFVETETDGGDTTYFLLHQLQVIERSIEDLHRYLERKAEEIQEVEALLKDTDGFNHRQLAILSDALRHPGRSYTLGAHADDHRVTHETARSDLSILRNHGLLERRKVGREYVFEAVADLVQRLKDLGA